MVKENQQIEKEKTPLQEAKRIGKVDDSKVYKVASGTGFYISKEGHIITNHHLINGCEKVKVHKKGISDQAIIVAVDRVNDLINI